MVSLEIRPKKLMILLLLLLLLFQYGIINNTGGILRIAVGYIDDLVAAICLCYTAYSIVCRRKITKLEKSLLLLFFILISLGIVSSLVNKFQFLYPSIIDAFSCSKFVLTFVGASIFIRSNRLRDDFPKSYNKIIFCIAFILFVFVILNIFVYPIFPVQDYRVFMYSQKLFFSHAAELAEMALFCLILLFYNSKFKSNCAPMVMLSAVIVSTMRYKEIAVVLLIWLIYLYFIKVRLKSRALLFGGAMIAIIILGYGQFSAYYNDTSTARALLTSVGILIANKYFPLGAGFATYASSMSREYYSPLYYEYGLNLVWGLGGGENYNFISDTFWPIVLGQFGWFGLAVVVIIFIKLIRACLSIRKDMYSFACSTAVIAFFLIVSMGTSSIFNPFSVLCALMLAYFLGVGRQEVRCNYGCKF